MSYYDFVPVDSTLRRVSYPDSRLKYNNMYIIRSTFRAKTDLHISSGKKKLLKRGSRFEILLQHYRNSNGIPVIPGSSFKGAVSKNFLALCGSAEMTANLFGAAKKRAVISKLFFSDLIPEGNVKIREVEVLRQWKPQSSMKGHVKFYIGRSPKTKRYGLVECIPSGTIIRGKINGYNLNDIELGGLLASMGYGIDKAVFKIGYAKPQGFGQLELVKVELYEILFDWMSFREIQKDPEIFFREFHEKFEKRIKDYAQIIFRGI